MLITPSFPTLPSSRGACKQKRKEKKKEKEKEENLSNKLADSGSKTNLAPHSRQEESALLILSVLSVYGNAGHQHTARDSAESTPPQHLNPAAFTPVRKIQVKIEKCFS